MKRKALFSGTFDPFTIAHDAIVQRALSFTDEIIIAIGFNPEKKNYYSLEERFLFIKKLYADEKKISVSSYDMLTIDFAKKTDVNFILRGVRNTIDFEYEKNLAVFNKKLSGIETVFLISEPEYAHISSTLVRELLTYKIDISHLIPIIK
jgi:pantetheine-phosphate adenylyltransferase